MKEVLICLLFFGLVSAVYSQKDYQIKPVDFTKVHFTDNFWKPRIETNRTVSIPTAFGKCEETGRMDNFAIAGNLKKGEHKGDFPFDDTDVYKIIEGASYSLAVKYDAKLDKYVDSLIYLISSAQEIDGYLYTCRTNNAKKLFGWMGKERWERLNSHELYDLGHLYEAAVAHYKSTGKRTLLHVAIKSADLICKVFGPNPGQKRVPSGHPIVEMALAKLYRVTNDERYLNLAKFFLDETGYGRDGHKLSEYSQDHKPIKEQDEIVGHAVRAGYLYSGVTDVAAITGNEDYRNAAIRVWDNLANKKLYVTGGMGSRAQGEGFGPNYELPDHTDYCETCASIANVYWSYRMFLLTGEAKYIDVVEKALYNGVISGVSLSGDRYFYDNPLASAGQHERAPWFGCACCPGNITRFMASVPGYVYAVKGDDVYINLYAAGEADVKTASGEFKIIQETNYPWDGKIVFKFSGLNGKSTNVKLRIPGWAVGNAASGDLYSFAEKTKEHVTLMVNGKETELKIKDGYAELPGGCKEGDEIILNLPMPVRKVIANENAEYLRGKAALQRGPIVYCLEGIDQNDKHVFNLYSPQLKNLTASFENNFLGGVVTLSGKGKALKGTDKYSNPAFKAIPYYAWNNRGAGEMTVWIPEEKDLAVPVPKETLASKSKCTSSSDPIPGLNDQFEPVNSSDISKPYFYWWSKKGSNEWVEYEFPKEEEVSQVQVYWAEFEHYDGSYKVPEKWEVNYLVNGEWKPVKNKTEYKTELDKYNKVDFEKVKTTKLRIKAKLQKGYSGGILEWKVS
jgi:uncharacterized protein